jgi:hypothetical protein
VIGKISLGTNEQQCSQRTGTFLRALVLLNRFYLRGLGILFWIAVAVAGVVGTRSAGPDSNASNFELAKYFTAAQTTTEATDPAGRLRIHDPIFSLSKDSTWAQIGHVVSVSANGDNQVTLLWYAGGPPDACRLVQYRNSGRLEDVIATMLPPAKRLQIQHRLTAAMSAHGDELTAAFVPLVQSSLRRSLPVIEEEFSLAVARHRGEIDQLAQRWNDEVVEQRLIPLARREILPIVRDHGEPIAERIGKELWDRASIWRFGWRAVYDKSPLPRKDLVQDEWRRFVDEEAVPVFESHMDDIVVSVQRIVSDVAASDAVRSELADVASGIAADPKSRQLVRDILKETLVDNQRLQQVWGSVWTSDQAQRALDMAGDRLEPVVRQIGDDLFGSQEEGINPDFARVLRNQILGKDRRWIVLTPAHGPPLTSTIAVADESMPYPIVYMADRNRTGDGAP